MKLKIVEVKSSYKGSSNYNSAEVSFTANVSEDIDAKLVAEELFERAKEIVEKKLEIEGKPIKEEQEQEPEEKNKQKLWKKCPKCGKNCKLGFNEKEPNKYYCATCKEFFD